MRTVLKKRFISRSQQIVRVDRESGPQHYLPASAQIRRHLRAALDIGQDRIVLLSDYGKGTVNDEHLDLLSRAAEAGDPRTLVDPWGSSAKRYAGLWGLKANRDETAALLAWGGFESAAAEGAARRLHSLGFDVVWLTLGAEGSRSMSSWEGFRWYRSRARSVYDVTGAGDTFLAALGVSLGEGGSIGQATRFANAASGVAVERTGTSVVAREQVIVD
jgi:rfaE bifunctional protein kinase chain/domain